MEEESIWTCFQAKVEDLFMLGYNLPKPLQVTGIQEVEFKLEEWKEKTVLETFQSKSLPEPTSLDRSDEEFVLSHDPEVGNSLEMADAEPSEEDEGGDHDTVQSEKSSPTTPRHRKKRKLDKRKGSSRKKAINTEEDFEPTMASKRPRRSTPSVYRRKSNQEKAAPLVIVKKEKTDPIDPTEDLSQPEEQKLEIVLPKKCDLCFKMYTSKLGYLNHMEKHEQNASPCDYCPFIGTTDLQLFNHINEMHADNITSEDISILKKRNHGPVRGLFPCHVCDKVFTYERNRRMHQEMHSTGPLKCPHCSKDFYSQGGYDNHVRIHLGEGASCDQCGFVAGSLSSLNTHIRRTHDKIKKHLCDICGEGFITSYRMKRHKLGAHLREQFKDKHKCPHCDHATHCEYSLKVHIKNLHTEVEGYTCSICGLKYKYKNSLLEHQLRHTSKKSFKCDRCPFKGVCMKDVRNHVMRMHKKADEKCEICGKLFKQRGHLVRHRVVHTGEKQFSCKHCSYCCNVKGNLRKHMLQVHKVNERIRPVIDKIDKCEELDETKEVILPVNQFNQFSDIVAKDTLVVDQAPEEVQLNTDMTTNGKEDSMKLGQQNSEVWTVHVEDESTQSTDHTEMTSDRHLQVDSSHGEYVFVGQLAHALEAMGNTESVNQGVRYMPQDVLEVHVDQQGNDVAFIDNHGNETRAIRIRQDLAPDVENKVEAAEDESPEHQEVVEEGIVHHVGSIEMNVGQQMVQNIQYWTG